MDEQRREKEIRQRTIFVGTCAIGAAAVGTLGGWMTLQLPWPLRLVAAPALGVAALIITWLVVAVMLGEVELVWPFSRRVGPVNSDHDTDDRPDS